MNLRVQTSRPAAPICGAWMPAIFRPPKQRVVAAVAVAGAGAEAASAAPETAAAAAPMPAPKPLKGLRSPSTPQYRVPIRIPGRRLLLAALHCRSFASGDLLFAAPLLRAPNYSLAAAPPIMSMPKRGFLAAAGMIVCHERVTPAAPEPWTQSERSFLQPALSKSRRQRI